MLTLQAAATGARSRQAPAALEVTLSQVLPVTDAGYTIVVGEVVYAHVREGLVRPNGLVDAQRLLPLARLGGDEFATLGEVFELTRPPLPLGRERRPIVGASSSTRDTRPVDTLERRT